MTSDPENLKRRRRSGEEWRTLLSDPEIRGLPRAQLAKRFACSLATINVQLAKMKAPETVPIGRLLEVSHKPHVDETSDARLVLQTPSGVTLRFSTLPSPEFLGAILKLAS